MRNAPTCPVLLLPARLSSRPPPRATSDEGAEGRKELFRRRRKSLATHLGARRGGAVRRSELGRRINGVSELLPSRESILMVPHYLDSKFICFYGFENNFQVILNHVLYPIKTRPSDLYCYRFFMKTANHYQ